MKWKVPGQSPGKINVGVWVRLLVLFLLALPSNLVAENHVPTPPGPQMTFSTTAGADQILAPGKVFSMVAPDGALLRWSNQVRLKCRERLIGKILPDGLQLDQATVTGTVAMTAANFRCLAPMATISLQNAWFQLQIDRGTFFIFLLAGQADVFPAKDPTHAWTIGKGEGLMFRDGTWILTSWQRPAAGLRSPLFSFEELFPSHGGTIVSGFVNVIGTDSGNGGQRLTAGQLIPLNALVANLDPEEVLIRLNFGPTIQMAPETQIRCLAREIFLERGCLFIRNPSEGRAVSINGPGRVLIDRGSVCDLQCDGNRLLVRVQAGSARSGEDKAKFLAGNSFSVTGGKTEQLERFPKVRSWRPPKPAEIMEPSPPGRSQAAAQPVPKSANPPEPTGEEPNAVDLQEFLEEFADD